MNNRTYDFILGCLSRHRDLTSEDYYSLKIPNNGFECEIEGGAWNNPFGMKVSVSVDIVYPLRSRNEN